MPIRSWLDFFRVEPEAFKPFPFLEVIIFFVLGTIVVFRKQWSSNDAYRMKSPSSSMDLASATQKLNLSKEAVSESLKEAMGFVASQSRKTIDTSTKKLFQRVNPARLLEKGTITNSLHIMQGNHAQHFQHHIFMKISDDNVLKILSYLQVSDVLNMSAVCRNLHSYMNSEMVWEFLWMEHFNGMWQSPKIVAIRQQRGILWSPHDISHANNNDNNHGHHQPLSSGSCVRKHAPKQGWKAFYIEFQYSWLDWLLAGFSSHNRCLIALNGSILDITSFLHEHPGSTESLVDHAGCDASVVFKEIGHSSYAKSLTSQFLCWSPHSTTAAVASSSQQQQQQQREEELLVRLGGVRLKSKFAMVMRKKQSILRRLLDLQARSEAEKEDGVFADHHLHHHDYNNNDDDGNNNDGGDHGNNNNGRDNIIVEGTVVDDDDDDDDNNNNGDNESVMSDLLMSVQSFIPSGTQQLLEKAATTTSLPFNLFSQQLNLFNKMKLEYEQLSMEQLPAFLSLPPQQDNSNEDNKDNNSNNNNNTLVAMVQGLGGYQSICCHINKPTKTSSSTTTATTITTTTATTTKRVRHTGQVRVVFDPLAREWRCWWSCCGAGHRCQQ